MCLFLTLFEIVLLKIREYCANSVGAIGRKYSDVYNYD